MKKLLIVLLLVGMLFSAGCGSEWEDFCYRQQIQAQNAQRNPGTISLKTGWTEEEFLSHNQYFQPEDKNRSVGSWGIHEQWVYRSYDLYVYFENGILTSWQN